MIYAHPHPATPALNAIGYGIYCNRAEKRQKDAWYRLEWGLYSNRIDTTDVTFSEPASLYAMRATKSSHHSNRNAEVYKLSLVVQACSASCSAVS
jgi:hypothetical protein